MKELQNKKAFICDMDGVLYHGNRLLEGVKEFVQWLEDEDKKYLFLTNSSERSPQELSDKLRRLGVNVDKNHFYTSAQSTAYFLSSQKKKGSVYVIGEAGLINALYEAGFTMNNIDPDYVVVGEGLGYNYDTITTAVNLVINGAKLIGCNPDLNGPTEHGMAPATGSLIAPIELSTNKKAYFLGKPNPLMMRHALNKLNVQREETVIIGDRMDTDIIAGMESMIDTVLVLSGCTKMEDLKNFAYAPTYVLAGVGDIIK